MDPSPANLDRKVLVRRNGPLPSRRYFTPDLNMEDGNTFVSLIKFIGKQEGFNNENNEGTEPRYGSGFQLKTT